MSTVFISYRRSDCPGHAGRLYDRLVDRFGADRVFMDIAAIGPGVDFAQHITEAIASCDVLLALVGDDWFDSVDLGGGRRLDQDDDLVRLEISAALRRPELRVIPVLVEGAAMPLAHDLPPDIQQFARRNAFELRDTHWRYDIDRLIEAVAPASPNGRRSRAARSAGMRVRRWLTRPLAWRPPRSARISAAVAVAALTFVVALVLLLPGRRGPDPAMSQRPPSRQPSVGKAISLNPGRLPGRPAVGAGGLWVPEGGNRSVARIDTTTRAISRLGVEGRSPVAADIGAGRLWVASGATLNEVDPAAEKVVRSWDVGVGLTSSGCPWMARIASCGSIHARSSSIGQRQSPLAVTHRRWPSAQATSGWPTRATAASG